MAAQSKSIQVPSLIKIIVSSRNKHILLIYMMLNNIYMCKQIYCVELLGYIAT